MTFEGGARAREPNIVDVDVEFKDGLANDTVISDHAVNSDKRGGEAASSNHSRSDEKGTLNQASHAEETSTAISKQGNTRNDRGETMPVTPLLEDFERHVLVKLP